MRPILLTLFFPILRASSTLARRAPSSVPAIQYPVCRRNFTCSSPALQDYKIIMADMCQEQAAEVERLAEPAENEQDILNNNKGPVETCKVKDTPNDLKVEGEQEEEKLPKLSAADFKTYNSMAEHMDYFHNHFRQSWTLLYSACENNRRPANLSLKQFLNTGIQFCSHLSTHHSIEEHHIFPILAAKMPEFKAGRNCAQLLQQHKDIHAGMDKFEEYLEKCRSGETELELRVLKEKMDTWGDVLWKHLDQEVKTLGAENMRKYWTLQEMRRMPM